MADRHQFRAKWHDYNEGIYFITICSHEKECIFGKIVENNFLPTELGQIITDHIQSMSAHYSDIEIWNSVVMPNHIHLILAITGTQLNASGKNQHNPITFPNSTQSNYGCLKPMEHGAQCEDFHHNSRLATVVGAFKAGVTRTARTRKIASLPAWQPRFHEHIIRNQESLHKITHYISTNIENWHKDCFAK